MTIEFLKKLEQNKKIGSEIIQGVSEIEIVKAEAKFGIKFPKAYREYLSLAGKYAGNLPMLDTDDLKTISSDWHQKIQKEEVAQTNLKKELTRPYWLFAESNGCEVFYFFYLDENTENPDVYLVDYTSKENIRQVDSLKMNFSSFIDYKVDAAKRIEKDGW
ncbi:hypothetical protein AR438_03160 [Chryseobacterium aquaticum]|uniref:Knr4/Smi1-like domain-containing protein n=1 Tax=Chryseobacterium aquaticum TaxID=452084 RepID=A0A0Q3KBP9_9FLAO|nr:SMI1/KNR4 family protein [Chryseobacterium aquaticum]KQK27219.1 hypothetical protein AR438_03160 [Chryseobacterium aquaticum]